MPFVLVSSLAEPVTSVLSPFRSTPYLSSLLGTRSLLGKEFPPPFTQVGHFS